MKLKDKLDWKFENWVGCNDQERKIRDELFPRIQSLPESFKGTKLTLPNSIGTAFYILGIIKEEKDFDSIEDYASIIDLMNKNLIGVGSATMGGIISWGGVYFTHMGIITRDNPIKITHRRPSDGILVVDDLFKENAYSTSRKELLKYYIKK
jgi:hypothetical protein